MNPPDSSCSDCLSFTRRDFLKTGIGGLSAVSAAGLSLPPAMGAPTPASKPETLVATLFKSLDEGQRGAVCHPFDHPLRQAVNNNWHINDKSVAEFYTKDQQEMIRQIFVGLHSPEY